MGRDRIHLPGLPRDAARVLIAEIEALKDEQARLRRKAGRAGIVTSDYSAKAGEFVNVEARSGTLLTITLPESTPALRGARVTLAFRNSNDVRIVAVQGTVNGEAFVINDRPGTYDATADGLGGWFVQVGVSEEGSGAGGGGGSVTSGALIRITLYNAAGSGTHTCDATATQAYLVGCGSGGAGGGANAAAGQASVGGGASAGGTFEVLIDLTDGLDIDYVIGAGGTGAVGTSGSAGAATTAEYDGVTYTGAGGLGSVSSTSGTTLQLIGCVAGGAATNGDLNLPGGPPGIAVRETASSGCGGNGGPSAHCPGPRGASAAQGSNASSDGFAGTLGAGGSGAVNFNNNPAAGNTGGNGGDGFFWVYEYT